MEIEVIELPTLPMSASLDQALIALRERKRSAVVAYEGDLCCLFHAVEIYMGQAQKKASLADLERKNLIRRLSKPELAHAVAAVNTVVGESLGGFGSIREIEQQLDPAALYGVVSISDDQAKIATRHAALATALGSGPADCYCAGPRQHNFPPPDLHTGDDCPFDGHKIYCKS